MMQESETKRVESHQIARWLRRRYYFALSLIALFIVASQVLLHHHLVDQKHSASVVNIAGRQRMLSERIMRLIDWCTAESTFLKQCRIDLQEASQLFEHSHKELHDRNEEGMLSGRNSEAVVSLFKKAEPHFQEFLTLARCAAQSAHPSCSYTRDDLVKRAHESQQSFVKIMDITVFQYSEEGDAATQRLSRMEWILGGLALLLLLIEYRYIFRPTGFLIQSQVQEIERSLHRAERAEQNARMLSQYKTDFLSSMSHELRTPMASILGFADEIVQDDTSREEMKEAASYIRRSGDHLLGILNDVLDIARVESGSIVIDLAPESLFSMMMDVEIIMRQQAVRKGLSFTVEYEYPLPKTLLTDRLRLTQVLVNVIGNAIKFTETGSVRIRVSYRKEERVLQFTVIDTGIGIDAEDQIRIFEAFEQGERGIARRYEGTGLGLSIAKTIIELLGGTIRLESVEDKGSTFTVSHPYKDVDDNQFVTEPQPLANHMSILQTTTPVPRLKGKVLLVEDGRMLQLFTMKLLQRMGIEAVLAHNGFEAIQLAEDGDFDVVLMDMQMPVMDGFTATRKLIAQGYTKPIIALTASVTKEEASSCFDAGCVDFLSKPFDRSEFYRLLSRYMKEEAS